jgi:hypothetical protein
MDSDSDSEGEGEGDDVSGEDERDRRSQLDELLVELLASGRPYAEAGAMAGVSERTVRRRMSDPVFTGRVSRRRGEYVGALVGRLVDVGEEAVEVMRGGLRDESAAVRLRAADLVLRWATHLRHGHELETRLAALETAAGAAAATGTGDDDA